MVCFSTFGTFFSRGLTMMGGGDVDSDAWQCSGPSVFWSGQVARSLRCCLVFLDATIRSAPDHEP